MENFKIDENGNAISVESGPPLYNSIISSLIKDEVLKVNQRTPQFWGREAKMASKLVKKYPEDAFWKYFSLPYKLNSLAFLISERGAKELAQQYVNWTLTKTDAFVTIDDNRDLNKKPKKVEDKFSILGI